MTASTASEPILSILRNHHLLTDDQHRSLVGEVDPEDLLAELQQRGWLTAYQADRLRRARPDELVLGPYVILDQLGEGGMGRVYKARETAGNRLVALKVIHHHHVSGGSDALVRFQREAKAAAALGHPNVVRVIDAGQARGRYYIAMELLEGSDLGELVKHQGRLPVNQACDYIRQACLGLQHIHERGLIHRDIKPSNLFVSAYDPGRQTRGLEPVLRPTALGIVKILDLGLVRRNVASVNAALTREDMTLGTPDYIAPEQAKDSSRVDIRADLYGLGCTFYHLLTGQPPFPNGTALEKLIMHTMDYPAPVESLRPELPRTVGVIVRKLMAKAPAERYQTPLEVLQAVDAVTASTPRSRAVPNVLAAPTVPPESPTPSMKATPLPPLAVGRPSALGNPHRTALPARPATVTAPLAEAAPSVQDARLVARLKAGGCVTCLAFTHDRNTLASAEADGKVRLWGFHDSKPRQVAVLDSDMPYAGALAFDPAGQTLAVGSGDTDGRLELWHVAGLVPSRRAALPAHTAAITGLAFAPAGNSFASAGDDASVLIWDVGTHDPRRRSALKGDAPGVAALAYAPDGRSLAVGQRNGLVRLWTLGRIWSPAATVLSGHTSGITSIAYAPDSRALVTGSADQTVRIWDLAGKPHARATLTGATHTIRLVSFTAEGKEVSAISASWQALHWEAGSGTMLPGWTLPRDLICSLAITHDGRYLAAGLTSGRINIYRLGAKRPH
jgi:serine/threonine-protein kinase